MVNSPLSDEFNQVMPLGSKVAQWVNCSELYREILSEYQIYSWTLSVAMLSYTFINSHSQVSDPGPKGPLVLIGIFVSSQ